MFARSIRMMLLSAILMIVASAVDARACEGMEDATGPIVTHEASSQTPRLIHITNSYDGAGIASPDSHDVDGCAPRCCQSDICCHLMTVGAPPDLWSPRGEELVAMAAVDGTARSSQPDLPPPKGL